MKFCFYVELAPLAVCSVYLLLVSPFWPQLSAGQEALHPSIYA